MKTRSFCLAAMLALLCGCYPELPHAYNQPLNSPGGEFSVLPPAVQNSVRAQAGMAEISGINRNFDGPVKYYEILFRNPQLYPPLYLAPDGSVLNSELNVVVAATPASLALASGKMSTGIQRDELPQRVILSIRRLAPTAEVENISRITTEGQVYFSVTFTDPQNHPALLMHDDGTLAK